MKVERGKHRGSNPGEGETKADGGELLSAISHELNTPLTVIAGYAELLALRDDDYTRREAAARIQEAAETLRSAIDETLLVFRGLPTEALRSARAARQRR